MSTQSVEVAFVREKRPRRHAIKGLLKTFALLWEVFTWIFTYPSVVRREHGHVDNEVDLPSQRPQWVYAHVPRGLHHER